MIETETRNNRTHALPARAKETARKSSTTCLIHRSVRFRVIACRVRVDWGSGQVYQRSHVR